MLRLLSELINIRYIMFYSSLDLIFPTQAKLPITVARLIDICIYHTTIELFTKHSYTKLTRFYLTFFNVLHESVNVGESLAKVKM